MPRIILSWIALVWIILSLASTGTILVGLFSSSWLVRIETAESRRFTDCPMKYYPSLIFPEVPSITDSAFVEHTALRSPSVGPWLRCQPDCLATRRNVWTFSDPTSTNRIVRCQLALWGFGNRPAQANVIIWTSACLCLLGSLLMLIAMTMVLLSLCKREICDRSMHSFSGAIQGLSDILLVAGMIIWPIGWDSITVREVCGGAVGPYSKGSCTFGWGPVVAGCGTLLLFISSLLAGAADKSLGTRAVTRQMLLEGKTCVFLH